jgi:indole-3-glycerol phosphate synthase
MSRFRQAISEGDGISVIPMLVGDVEELAGLAEAAGAEAVAVAEADVARACASTGLPVLARTADLEAAAEAGADACVLPSDGRLPQQHERAHELGLDCVVDVRDEDALQAVLEHVDPDIVLLSEDELEEGEEDFERTLDLLADVPAGKLVISDARVSARAQVVALERAGVDAILVSGELLRPDFSATLAELTGRALRPR